MAAKITFFPLFRNPTWQCISETLVFDASIASLFKYLDFVCGPTVDSKLGTLRGPPKSALEMRTHVAAYLRDAGIRRLGRFALQVLRFRLRAID
jgi:hypothetical protein